MPLLELTNASFEDTVTGHDIVLVDFWAAWCGPCRQFAPVYERAAVEHDDIVFGKVDTEAEKELAAMAQITSIPTLMAFREGILVFSQPGALPPAQLQGVIEAVRGLDMADVHRQIAQQKDHPDELDLDTFAAEHAAGGFVLDVREADEYAAGHVPGAVHIPMGELPNRVAELPADQRVLVICQSGGRSRAMVDFLQGEGVDAINVSDGTAGWASRNWPLDR